MKIIKSLMIAVAVPTAILVVLMLISGAVLYFGGDRGSVAPVMFLVCIGCFAFINALWYLTDKEKKKP